MNTSIEDKIKTSIALGGIGSWYGLRARAYFPSDHSAIFTKEEAVALFPNLKDQNNIRHGVICYPQVLTVESINTYELIVLDKSRGLELMASTELEEAERKQALINTLAFTLNVPENAFVFLELEQDGQLELIKAFKQTSIFKERFENKAFFQEAVKCFKTITPAEVINELKRIKQCSAKAA